MMINSGEDRGARSHWALLGDSSSVIPSPRNTSLEDLPDSQDNRDPELHEQRIKD